MGVFEPAGTGPARARGCLHRVRRRFRHYRACPRNDVVAQRPQRSDGEPLSCWSAGSSPERRYRARAHCCRRRFIRDSLLPPSPEPPSRAADHRPRHLLLLTGTAVRAADCAPRRRLPLGAAAASVVDPGPQEVDEAAGATVEVLDSPPPRSGEHISKPTAPL